MYRLLLITVITLVAMDIIDATCTETMPTDGTSAVQISFYKNSAGGNLGIPVLHHAWETMWWQNGTLSPLQLMCALNGLVTPEKTQWRMVDVTPPQGATLMINGLILIAATILGLVRVSILINVQLISSQLYVLESLNILSAILMSLVSITMMHSPYSSFRFLFPLELFLFFMLWIDTE